MLMLMRVGSHGNGNGNGDGCVDGRDFHRWTKYFIAVIMICSVLSSASVVVVLVAVVIAPWSSFCVCDGFGMH